MPKIEVFVYLPLALVGTMGGIVASFVLSQTKPLSALDIGNTLKRRVVTWFIVIFQITWAHPFFYVNSLLFGANGCECNLECKIHMGYHLFVLFVVDFGFILLMQFIQSHREISDDFS